MELKRLVRSLILVALGCLALSPSRLLAKDKESGAKSWLASFTDPAKINVDGVWDSGDDWGTVILHQTKDAREITGTCSASEIEGVVSGNTLYLAFVWHDRHGKASKIYTASLTLGEDGGLRGHYARGISPPNKEDLTIKLRKTVSTLAASAEAEPG